MRTSILFAAAFVAASPGPSVAGQAGEPQYFVEGMHCLGKPFGLRLPATLPELLALAPVVSRQALEVEQWEGYQATREMVRFKGLDLGIVTFSNDPKRYSLASATIRSAEWSRISPFSVGQGVDAVHKLLGGIGEDDTSLRSVYSGENESVHFESRAGRVTAVTYECYTG